jgi:glutamate racemase
MEQGADTLVLGCTHYPFLRDTLQRIVGQDVVLIDPAVAVATELARRLGDNRRLNKKPIGTTQFFTTGNVAHVQYVVSHLWGDAAIVEAMAEK